MMVVKVIDGDIDNAIEKLKRKVKADGDAYRKNYYQKPTDKRKLKQRKARAKRIRAEKRRLKYENQIIV